MHGAGAESRGGNWALCYDSSTDCTTCPSTTHDVVSAPTHCSCPSGSNTFHGGCNAHNETVVIGHNSLGFTFGGFAQATWAGNYDYATEAAGDFLFRLWPGEPVAYLPKGHNMDYQWRNPGAWPDMGGGNLGFGANGALGQGQYAHCVQGFVYQGDNNDACGGAGNWGATEMEVWYRVGS